MTGASVTNKGEASLRYFFRQGELMTCLSGIYYESGKEPPPDAPPKLHLLIESNEEFRVRRLVVENRTFLNKHFARWRTQYAKSNGCLSKRRRLRSKPRCAIPLRRQGATASCKISLTFGFCLFSFCTRITTTFYSVNLLLLRKV